MTDWNMYDRLSECITKIAKNDKITPTECKPYYFLLVFIHNPQTDYSKYSEQKTAAEQHLIHIVAGGVLKQPAKPGVCTTRRYSTSEQMLSLDLIKVTEMVFGNFEGKDVRSGSFTVEPFWPPFQGGHCGGTPVDIGHPSKSFKFWR